jgi:tripartite-type tricarboxylate transporter receptor subunit TctC
VIAQGISGPLGQQVIVENRPVIITVETVMKSPPDGYNLLVITNPFFVAPLLQDLRYDAVTDFAPVTMVSREQNLLVVHPSLPVKSVRELIALAKARPGALNYGSGSTGSSTHLAGELFKFMANVNIVRVPYKGGGQAVIDLLGGHVQLMFATAPSVAPQVKSGRLRALAVTGTRRSALLPDLPTVAASGLPGYELVGLDGVFAPAKTPAAVINRLNLEMMRYLRSPDAKEKFLAAGTEPTPSTPEELTAAMKADIAKLSKLIKSAGIKAD